MVDGSRTHRRAAGDLEAGIFDCSWESFVIVKENSSVDAGELFPKLFALPCLERP